MIFKKQREGNAVERTGLPPTDEEKLRLEGETGERQTIPHETTSTSEEDFASTALPPTAATSSPPVRTDAQLQQSIQNILSEDIAELYRTLPLEQQRVVVSEGKKTIMRITELLKQTRVRLKELVEIIRNWLQKIPGINRFFIEQEAKIKAQKILKLKQ